MRSIGVRELRTVLSKLERLLAREGEIVITRRGKPVARILPSVPVGGMPSRAGRRRRMRRLDVGSQVLIREDRDARG